MIKVDERMRQALRRAAADFGTPSYVYSAEVVDTRIRAIRQLLGSFEISFAVKSNPNAHVLRYLDGRVDTLDVSSGGELDLALALQWPAERLTFSGPGKRYSDLQRALQVGCGELVCENLDELEDVASIASELGIRRKVLLRINPMRLPRGFGVRMAGKPSQFGFDEETLSEVIGYVKESDALELSGFHVYSGTNCLDVDAIAENFQIMSDLFVTLTDSHRLRPDKLIYGSGFGIPYHAREEALDFERLASDINSSISAVVSHPVLSECPRALELGRYVIGPAGYFLSSVVREKVSRGTNILICDGGFNNHLAAFGMLGMVIRKDYPIFRVADEQVGAPDEYMITGPLCTTIDIMSHKTTMPKTVKGDVLGVASSGAYGLTASPVNFISHPHPREVWLEQCEPYRALDITQ